MNMTPGPRQKPRPFLYSFPHVFPEPVDTTSVLRVISSGACFSMKGKTITEQLKIMKKDIINYLEQI